MSTCIPYASGIFGVGMQTPPNWGIPGVSTVVIDTIPLGNPYEGAIKDSRWQGALNQSFGIGAAEDASFRALFHEDAGTRFIYFSWHIKFDTDPGSVDDRLYVAIAPSPGGGDPLLLEIKPFEDTGEHLSATLITGQAFIHSGRRKSDGTMDAFATNPAWLNDTRAWRVNTGNGQCQWAIHMRVKVDQNATDIDGAGLRLTPQFKMWYGLRIKTAVPATWDPTLTYTAGAIVSYNGTFYVCEQNVTVPGQAPNLDTSHWEPKAAADFSSGGFLRLNYPMGVRLTNGGASYPDPNTSGETFTYGNIVPIHGVSCASSSGISLDFLDVGTENNPSSYIDPLAANTFYALPKNNGATDVPANTIMATFRLANWGSGGTNATWSTIQTNVGNKNRIRAGQKASKIDLVDGDNRNTFQKSNVASQYSNVASEPHQCMLVELSGGGLLYTNTSVVRNMDFINNSKVERQAEINIKGLGPTNSRPRDVYLAVETQNMPVKTNRDMGAFAPITQTKVREFDDRDTESFDAKIFRAQSILRERYEPDMTHTYDTSPQQRLALMIDILREVSVTTEDLERIFPTYRVHVYYDTGEKWSVDGIDYPILELRPSFGFYAYHEGQLLGFNHQLRGCTRVAENFYVVRVPNNGSTQIKNIIHAIAPDDVSMIEPEEPIRPWPTKPKVQPCDPDPSDGWLMRLLKFFCRLIRSILIAVKIVSKE